MENKPPLPQNCFNCGRPLLEWAEQDAAGHWYCGGCGFDLRQYDLELDEEASLPDLTYDEDDTPAIYHLLEDIGLL